MKWLKTAAFVFVLAILVLAAYMAYVDVAKLWKAGSSKREGFSAEPKLKICLYKASWCSHCTDYLKSNVFENTYMDVKGKHSDVVFATIDFDENKALAEKYNIDSFPSIIAVDANGKLLDTFDGDRYKKEDLVRFVEKNRARL